MWNTIEELERDFDARIRAAADDKKIDLELEKQKAIAQFYRDQNERQQINLWIQEALVAYPKARPKEITGRTKEAIMAEAKASHEDVEKILADAREDQRKKDEEEAVRQGWGPSGVGGGGGGGGRAPGSPLSDDQQFEKDINDAHQGLRQGTLTPQQAERLQKSRIGVIATYFTDPHAVERAMKRR